MKLILILEITCLCITRGADADSNVRSHPPQHPFPAPAPLGEVPDDARYIDGENGDDAADGTSSAPWRTLEYALSQMSTGGTLVLRGGVHFAHLEIRVQGEPANPLVIRGFPGELAVIDGGVPVFQLTPELAWEPCEDGVAGEFRSVNPFPTAAVDGEQDGDGEVLVMGRFLDSLVPLHGYRLRGDLQSSNPWWNVRDKVGDDAFVYCGPGLWQERSTGFIHARLAATELPGLAEDNYQGAVDPRELPLCIATSASGPVVTITQSRHVTLKDLVVRGSAVETLSIGRSADVTLEGVTIYGGSPGIRVYDTHGLRMAHCAVRGLSAPWTWRGSLKYRSVEARLLSATSWNPSGIDNRDFEIAYCEFTDSVDGVFLGCVTGVRFHHNLVDNISDDGLFLTAPSGFDGHVAGGDVVISQNRISRCLTSLAFGVGHGRQWTLADDQVQTGSGAYVGRNVFDFRRPVHYQWPMGPDDPEQVPVYRGRFAGDHGSPAWEPMWVSHNTMVGGHTMRLDFGISGLSGGCGKGTTRDVLNNILCVDLKEPGYLCPTPPQHFSAAGNLLWSFDPSFSGAEDAWSERFARSFRVVAMENHLAQPQFTRYSVDWRDPVDLGLSDSSPAIDAGVVISGDWPDPLADVDQGLPDVGAIPFGTSPWRIGMFGRMDVCGAPASTDDSVPPLEWSFPDDHGLHLPDADEPHAVVIRGYPAFDAPIFEYLLRRRGVHVEIHDHEYVPLTPALPSNVKCLIFDGNFIRAGIEPAELTAPDLAALEEFLQAGGTVVLCRERHDLFRSDHGREFLARHCGDVERLEGPPPLLSVGDAEHPWIVHWSSTTGPFKDSALSPLPTASGESVLSLGPDRMILGSVPVGTGRLIYIGWSIGGQLTDNRRGSTPEADADIRAQVRTVEAIIDDVFE